MEGCKLVKDFNISRDCDDYGGRCKISLCVYVYVDCKYVMGLDNKF